MRQRLTLSQRARRRATRKNNQVRRAYPLLAHANVIDDWMTTEGQARADLERLDRIADAYIAELQKAIAERKREAEQVRAQVAERTDAETMGLLDAYLTKVYPPDYALGFWRRALAGEFDIRAELARIERARELGKLARAEVTT